MELFCNFQAMERNGDVVAEIKNCNSTNSAYIRKGFNTGKYKMCKDDIASPLFCSASDCLGKSIMMDSKDKASGTYLSPEEKLFYNTRRNDEYNVSAIESITNSSVDSFMSASSSPTWEKPPKLQNFSPHVTGKLSVQDPYLNGSKLQLTGVNPSVAENDSLSGEKNVSNNSEIINNKLLLDYEAETSSSSVEELYFTPRKECQYSEGALGKECEEGVQCPPGKRCEPPEEYYAPVKKCRLSEECCTPSKKIGQTDNKNTCQTFEIDSNHNVKIKSDVDHNENKNSPSFPSPIFPMSCENSAKEKLDSNTHLKNERLMPELSPPLICLDDEDSLIPENNQEQCEIIDVADSPKMPTLIPFTSEVDESIRIKVEALSDNEKDKNPDSDSKDEIRQPQVILQRIHLNHSNLPIEKNDNVSSLSAVVEKKSLIEGPEIEEIEGVRFFQFRSKQEMEEFNRKPAKTEVDEDMIVPTKTTDITQIKGWRTKYFAPESQFHNQPYQINFLKSDELGTDEKTSTDSTDEGKNNNSDKKENNSPDSKLKKVSSTSNCDGESEVKQQNDCVLNTDRNEEKIHVKNIKEEKEDIKNPMSAFVSEELDRYLLNSSSLKVSILEKINPNIVPIPPDAPILSLGKLRKVDKPFLSIHMFKRKREIFNEENVTSRPFISIVDSPESPNVITLDSTDESSGEEDIPVAKLRSKKRFPFRKRNLNSKGLKRKGLDNDLDQVSKRLVLRLTKEGNGVSKGYKVSDISCNKNKADPSSMPPSPSSVSSINDEVHEPVAIPVDGSLPVIKQTLFSKKNEPHLLEEFLNNLNMYGTRNDVAMLVQANQSYFDEGPTLNARNCAKAVSVLLSNKTFLDIKQKSKKKKLKTWQKYLPKKLSDKQKMKLSKRKTRIQSLLDDAGDMIQVVRGKRSIRLPARYLDSAVLAASEWVSPVITIDDDSSPKRSKRQSVEAFDKSKITEDSKTKDPEVSCTTLSSSESSSSSSDEDGDESVTSDISVKPADPPLKKPTSGKEIIGKRKKIDSPGIKRSLKESKKSLQMNVLGTPMSNKKINAATASFSKKHVLPNCFCKPTSRTAVFEHKSKEFYCFYCYALQKRLIDNAATNLSSSDTKKPDDIVTKKETNSALKSDSDISNVHTSGKNKDLASKSSKIKKSMEHNDSKKCDTNSSNNLSTAAPVENQPKCKRSDSSSPLQNEVCSDQLLKQDTKVTENVSSSVSSNNANNKFYLLFTPVKAAGNVNNSTPQTSHHVLPKQVEYPPKTNKKCKPPILMHKTPTGLVRNTDNESRHISHIDGAPCFKNTVPLRLPLNSHEPTPQSAALQLSKMAENASSSCQQLTISQVVKPCNSKDNIHPNIGIINNSVSNNTLNSIGSSKVVTAYKLGDRYWLCNTLMPPKESNPTTITSKVVTPAFVQKQFTNGPVISSVQSVQPSTLKSENCEIEVLPNGLTKSTIINYQVDKLISEAQHSQPNNDISQNDDPTALGDHFYHRRPQNRRKSPLSPKIYVDSEIEKLQLAESKSDMDTNEEIDVETVDTNEEIDIETVETNFIAFRELQKKDAESDSDISDDECANIFSSSTDHLASVYSKKSIKERKRRLLIKSGFENLKASSRHFKNAKSCLEILGMALCVIDSHKKKEKLYTFAKERLKIHNTMLLDKLSRLLEGVESPNIRDKIKMQIIKDLALERERHKGKKSELLLSKRYEGLTVNNLNSERNRPSSDAPDIGLKKEQSTAESTSSNSGSSAETVRQTRLNSNNSSPIKFEDMRQKVNATLRKKESKSKNNSDSTENLGSEVNEYEKFDEDSIQIWGSSEKNGSPSKSKQFGRSIEKVDMPMKEHKINKSPEKEFPGLIPLFHPKVYQENFSISQSSVHTPKFEESSHRTNARGLRQALSIPGGSDKQSVSASSQEREDCDDDVSIIGSKIVSPGNANAVVSESSAGTKTDIELTKAAEAANKLFGPCTVQKVQLKNGKTVFAYKPESSVSGSPTGISSDTTVRPALPLNTNGVRNLGDVFSAISASKSNSNQNKSTIPEEIVISDSEDESENVKDSTVSRILPEMSLNRVGDLESPTKRHSEESNSRFRPRHDDDSDSQNEVLHIDESCSQNTDSLSL